SLWKCGSVTPNAPWLRQARNTFHSPDAAEPPKSGISPATTPTARPLRLSRTSPYRSKPGLGGGARATRGRVRYAITMFAATAAATAGAISTPITKNSSPLVPSTVPNTEPRSTDLYHSRDVHTSVKTLNAIEIGRASCRERVEI